MYLGEGATVEELVRYGQGVSVEKLLDLIDSSIGSRDEEISNLRWEIDYCEGINSDLLSKIKQLRVENLELKAKLELANGNNEGTEVSNAGCRSCGYYLQNSSECLKESRRGELMRSGLIGECLDFKEVQTYTNKFNS